MTPEGKVKKDIKGYLDSLGPDCRYFSPQNMGMGESGVSDFIGVYCTRAFAIEVKRDEKQKPTPWQQRFLAEWARAGGTAMVASTAGQVRLEMEAIRSCYGPDVENDQ